MSRKRLLWILGPLGVLALWGTARTFGPGKDAPVGTGYAALELCTRTLHSGEDYERVKTRYVAPKALLVAQDGHLSFEHYAPGYTRDRPLLGWSMTKSVTALIAGLMQRDGKLAIDGPVGLKRWQGTAKASISWRQLLNMAPGLAWSEGYGGASDATEMLFSQPDQGAWAADRALVTAPGSTFVYSTGVSNIAMLAMRERLGGGMQTLYDYYQQRLFAPLGIRGGVIEPDASGTPVGGARGVLRPVDWLRLGQLVADQGVWQGERLITPEYMAFLQAPSPANEGYGGSLWRREAELLPAEARAHLPADIVFFAGVMGQLTMIVPSKQLVVLRMGVSLGGDLERNRARAEVAELVADLARAR